MSKPLLTKKTSVIIVCFALILVFSGWYCFNKFYLESRPLNYIRAIDKVYSSNLDAISVTICKSTNLHGSDAIPYRSAFGSRNNNFSKNSQDGVKLWCAKQLFLSTKALKAVKNGIPEILSSKQKEFFVIEACYDYSGNDEKKIRHLDMFVDPENYHIFIPKEYNEPIVLINSSVEYIEYEPNEIIKNLIDDLLKI